MLHTGSAPRALALIHAGIGADSRANAVASQHRLAKASAVVPGLGKQWGRSDKRSAVAGATTIMDGQVVEAGKRFRVLLACVSCLANTLTCGGACNRMRL